MILNAKTSYFFLKFIALGFLTQFTALSLGQNLPQPLEKGGGSIGVGGGGDVFRYIKSGESYKFLDLVQRNGFSPRTLVVWPKVNEQLQKIEAKHQELGALMRSILEGKTAIWYFSEGPLREIADEEMSQSELELSIEYQTKQAAFYFDGQIVVSREVFEKDLVDDQSRIFLLFHEAVRAALDFDGVTPAKSVWVRHLTSLIAHTEIQEIDPWIFWRTCWSLQKKCLGIPSELSNSSLSTYVDSLLKMPLESLNSPDPLEVRQNNMLLRQATGSRDLFTALSSPSYKPAAIEVPAIFERLALKNIIRILRNSDPKKTHTLSLGTHDFILESLNTDEIVDVQFPQIVRQGDGSLQLFGVRILSNSRLRHRPFELSVQFVFVTIARGDDLISDPKISMLVSPPEQKKGDLLYTRTTLSELGNKEHFTPVNYSVWENSISIESIRVLGVQHNSQQESLNFFKQLSGNDPDSEKDNCSLCPQVRIEVAFRKNIGSGDSDIFYRLPNLTFEKFTGNGITSWVYDVRRNFREFFYKL